MTGTKSKIAPKDGDYSEDEAQQRLEAALRGAREVGHKELKDISPKQGHNPTTNQKTKSGR
jgi:hypothetical protein